MRQILLYGLILGACLFLLQYTQYRLLFIAHSESLYTGIVAAICCGAGIWAGITLTRKWQQQRTTDLVIRDERTPVTPNEAVLTALNITPRELEVLDLIAQGLSNQEIAERLFVSPNTIKTHTANVFSKLDVQRRTQAIQKARELQII